MLNFSTQAKAIQLVSITPPANASSLIYRCAGVGMTNHLKQFSGFIKKRGIALGRLLSIVMVQGLAKLSSSLSKSDIFAPGMMTNDDISNLKKPEAHEVKAGITVPANASSSFSHRSGVDSFETLARTRGGAGAHKKGRP